MLLLTQGEVRQKNLPNLARAHFQIYFPADPNFELALLCGCCEDVRGKPFHVFMNDVPKSLKIALAIISLVVPLLTIIGNYAIYGYRIEALEMQVRAIQEDRSRRIEEYQRWQQQISTDVATTRTNVEWIRQELQRK